MNCNTTGRRGTGGSLDAADGPGAFTLWRHPHHRALKKPLRGSFFKQRNKICAWERRRCGLRPDRPTFPPPPPRHIHSEITNDKRHPRTVEAEAQLSERAWLWQRVAQGSAAGIGAISGTDQDCKSAVFGFGTGDSIGDSPSVNGSEPAADWMPDVWVSVNCRENVPSSVYSYL